MTSNEIAKKVYTMIDDKKGIDIKIIDISKISILADYFIIASGNNSRQVQSLADNVEEMLAKEEVFPKNIEGYQGANWILMDYNDVIIHIFDEEARSFYDIERIWYEGKEIEASNL